jgi:nucleotide-binding universal stress UspA family protein
MYKRILAPLDGTRISEHIARHIKAIAKGDNLPDVFLLRVLEPTTQISESSDEKTQDRKERGFETARKNLSQIAEDLQKEGIIPTIDVIEGVPADKILEYIKTKNIDLVIMGTHGRSGVSRLMMGSVAEKVLRQSPVPVLVVKPPGFGK